MIPSSSSSLLALLLLLSLLSSSSLLASLLVRYDEAAECGAGSSRRSKGGEGRRPSALPSHARGHAGGGRRASYPSYLSYLPYLSYPSYPARQSRRRLVVVAVRVVDSTTTTTYVVVVVVTVVVYVVYVVYVVVVATNGDDDEDDDDDGQWTMMDGRDSLPRRHRHRRFRHRRCQTPIPRRTVVVVGCRPTASSRADARMVGDDASGAPRPPPRATRAPPARETGRGRRGRAIHPTRASSRHARASALVRLVHVHGYRLLLDISAAFVSVSVSVEPVVEAVN